MPAWQFSVITGTLAFTALYAAGQLLPKQLENADLAGASLPEQHWAGARLGNADLQNADLRRSDLRGADLTAACLSGATLAGANLAGAKLRLVNLCGANLRAANLSAAVFEYTMYDAATLWPAGFLPGEHTGLCPRHQLSTPLLESSVFAR